MADTETTDNEEFLNEDGGLGEESALSGGSDASGWSGLSSETVSDLDGDEAVRHVEHIDGFWGPIYGLVIIFIVVTSIYLVAYYIELRDQRARRQSVRLSPWMQLFVRAFYLCIWSAGCTWQKLP